MNNSMLANQPTVTLKIVPGKGASFMGLPLQGCPPPAAIGQYF